jgi:hypothetical protein
LFEFPVLLIIVVVIIFSKMAMLDLLTHPVALSTVGAILLSIWLVLRPRKGGANAPPVVLTSPVVPIPLIGMALEFGKSPVKMIKRCLDQYGSVFTIPVRSVFDAIVYGLESCRTGLTMLNSGNALPVPVGSLDGELGRLANAIFSIWSSFPSKTSSLDQKERVKLRFGRNINPIRTNLCMSYSPTVRLAPRD